MIEVGSRNAEVGIWSRSQRKLKSDVGMRKIEAMKLGIWEDEEKMLEVPRSPERWKYADNGGVDAAYHRLILRTSKR